ncbi:hypothetical protein VHEMI02741 [[Torrubiella] hemipterigena]|uniref:RING-type E3 ubiquitin transferase n=1 Tax=[Torrubiella] hemipterigena TaxID=1531966 RepID=A0A0A1T8U9_9HYPO|nr:hypothetical protein VHEMI02741 [[Torrubiella] hemipterigena]
MFTQPVSAPPPGPQTSSATTTVNSSRSSRLRGFSYLRNYTSNHILSRDQGSSSGTPTANLSRRRSGSNLTRSSSYTTSPSSPTSAALDRSSSRLQHINSNPDGSPSLFSQRTSIVGITSSSTSLAADSSTRRTPPPSLPTSLIASTSAPAPAAHSRDTSPETSPSPSNMATTATTATATVTATTTVPATTDASAPTAEATPSIRFSSYYDPRSTRPSLSFSPITRTLPTGHEVIRVGRYSERDTQTMANAQGNQASAAPVGFKSKVVSRRHCEFWCEDGKWYIKDVKSSSGTFLNHIRLSPPSQESKAFPVNDGDIVQLGIDFKGGEEMIFRCVKMRLELNRGWQNKLNSFNVAAHKRLRTLNMESSTSQDCSICLNSIAPCQSLFVAPCSHTWHFKCIRSLLVSPQYPIFVCPNCRAGADLEADVDETSEEWQMMAEKEEQSNGTPAAAEVEAEATETTAPPPPAVVTPDDIAEVAEPEAEAGDVTMAMAADTARAEPEPAAATATVNNTSNSTTTQPVPIRNPASGSGRGIRSRTTPSPPGGREGPITPRNDAGPWVFDGTAGRGPAVDANGEMRSLDAAAIDADMTMNDASDGGEAGH